MRGNARCANCCFRHRPATQLTAVWLLRFRRFFRLRHLGALSGGVPRLFGLRSLRGRWRLLVPGLLRLLSRYCRRGFILRLLRLIGLWRLHGGLEALVLRALGLRRRYCFGALSFRFLGLLRVQRLRSRLGSFVTGFLRLFSLGLLGRLDQRFALRLYDWLYRRFGRTEKEAVGRTREQISAAAASFLYFNTMGSPAVRLIVTSTVGSFAFASASAPLPATASKAG